MSATASQWMINGLIVVVTVSMGWLLRGIVRAFSAKQIRKEEREWRKRHGTQR